MGVFKHGNLCFSRTRAVNLDDAPHLELETPMTSVLLTRRLARSERHCKILRSQGALDRAMPPLSNTLLMQHARMRMEYVHRQLESATMDDAYDCQQSATFFPEKLFSHASARRARKQGGERKSDLSMLGLNEAIHVKMTRWIVHRWNKRQLYLGRIDILLVARSIQGRVDRGEGPGFNVALRHNLQIRAVQQARPKRLLHPAAVAKAYIDVEQRWH